MHDFGRILQLEGLPFVEFCPQAACRRTKFHRATISAVFVAKLTNVSCLSSVLSSFCKHDVPYTSEVWFANWWPELWRYLSSSTNAPSWSLELSSTREISLLFYVHGQIGVLSLLSLSLLLLSGHSFFSHGASLRVACQKISSKDKRAALASTALLPGFLATSPFPRWHNPTG